MPGGNLLLVASTQASGQGWAKMPKRGTAEYIAEHDRYAVIQQHRFRVAADAVTAVFASFATVEAIALIGSVAKAIRREETRNGWLAHYCKDLDLAVWITRLHELDALRRARNRAAGRLFEQTGVGAAVHEIEVFLLEPGSNRYLGRLCSFRECPAHQLECLVEGCGRMPFLRQYDDFVFRAAAIAPGASVPLFDRARGGLLCRASELPDVIEG